MVLNRFYEDLTAIRGLSRIEAGGRRFRKYSPPCMKGFA